MQEYALYLFRTVAFTFYFSENNLPRKSRCRHHRQIPSASKVATAALWPISQVRWHVRFSALALGVLVVFVGSSLLKVPKGGNSSVSSAQLFAIYSRPLSGALFSFSFLRVNTSSIVCHPSFFLDFFYDFFFFVCLLRIQCQCQFSFVVF